MIVVVRPRFSGQDFPEDGLPPHYQKQCSWPTLSFVHTDASTRSTSRSRLDVPEHACALARSVRHLETPVVCRRIRGMSSYFSYLRRLMRHQRLDALCALRTPDNRRLLCDISKWPYRLFKAGKLQAHSKVSRG